MSSNPSTTCSSPVLDPERLNEFLAASRSESGAERRTAERNGFFAPVNLKPCTAPTQRWSAFSRDLSSDGIGLLHNMAIERGTICEVSVKCNGAELRHEAECMWCTAAGEGWYLSGWRFLSPRS
jgi:hypothetical protein